MASSGANGIAAAFLGREQARRREFEAVWNDGLDAVFADVAPYYDRASDVASLGLCSRWRERFIAAVELAPGERVLDVCAGTNAVGIALLRRRPDLRVYALDRSAAMQEVGRAAARALGLAIESVIGDAHDLPFPDDRFDVVTLQFASRHLRIAEVFAEVRRVLKPGGRFYHCDMLRPENPVVEELYCAFLKACVSVTAAIFGSAPEARRCRDYFVRGIRTFYSWDELSELLSQIGFGGISGAAAPGGVLGFHVARKA